MLHQPIGSAEECYKKESLASFPPGQGLGVRLQRAYVPTCDINSMCQCLCVSTECYLDGFVLEPDRLHHTLYLCFLVSQSML